MSLSETILENSEIKICYGEAYDGIFGWYGIKDNDVFSSRGIMTFCSRHKIIIINEILIYEVERLLENSLFKVNFVKDLGYWVTFHGQDFGEVYETMQELIESERVLHSFFE